MAREGRPPKTTEAKRRLGNPGGRPLPGALVALPPLVVGEVIEPLDQSPGAQLIRDLLGSAASAWLADPDRLAILHLIRDAWDERANLMADIRANGYGEGRYTRPVVLRLRDVEKSLTTWLSLSGLTPVDRSRLGIAEVKVQSSIDRLRARRDARLNRSRAG